MTYPIAPKRARLSGELTISLNILEMKLIAFSATSSSFVAMAYGRTNLKAKSDKAIVLRLFASCFSIQTECHVDHHYLHWHLLETTEN